MATLSQITTALERAWAAIRTVHPRCRPAVMVVYLNEAGDRWGHFWQDAWTARDNERTDEIHISSELLQFGGERTFKTLLHEAVHSVAAATGVQDTSRQGRYHNKRFAALAESMGLVVEPMVGAGCYTPDLAEATKALFANTIKDLDESIEIWQRRGLATVGGKGKGSRNVKLVCLRCGRIIRASRKCINLGTIRCNRCELDFVEARQGRP